MKPSIKGEELPTKYRETNKSQQQNIDGKIL